MSLKELSSLGLVYGTRARALRLLGLESHVELRAQYADLKPTDIDGVDRIQMRVGRPWPRQLLTVALAFAVVVSFALAATNTAVGDQPDDPLAGIPGLAPTPPPVEQTMELVVLDEEPQAKPVVKKRRAKKKRKKRRRRR